MNESIKYQLLKIIHYNGNILEIIHQGYEFGQVTYFIELLKQEHYIEYNDDNKLIIGPLGLEYIKDYQLNNDLQQYSKWILPQSEMWYKPMDKFDIYISKKKLR